MTEPYARRLLPQLARKRLAPTMTPTRRLRTIFLAFGAFAGWLSALDAQNAFKATPDAEIVLRMGFITAGALAGKLAYALYISMVRK